MQIAEIKVAELTDFLAGQLWMDLSPKPLTLLRAVSQSRNPRANPTDTALIIAYENNCLIGLVGLLPDFINGQAELPVSSNSCWWANPEKGKQVAVPLFLKAFACCNKRLFMTDCTPHTLAILKKSNWFDFPETLPGIRGYMKFNLHEVLPVKFPATRKIKSILHLTDKTINFLMIPYLKLIQFKIWNAAPKVEYPTKLNAELCAFIDSHSGNEFTSRSAEDLEWIVQNPWIKEKNSEPNFSSVDYPFSYLVDQFEQYFVKITEAGKTIGLLLISIRDGNMKVPYSYLQEKHASMILKVIYQQVLIKKAVTLTVFCPKIVHQMNSEPHPFIFRKKVKRLVAISKQLSESYRNYPEIQDGDGDVVFT